MAHGLRLLRWRAALVLAAAATVALWFFLGRDGTGYLVQIDYTWAGEYLDSAQVVIDGEVAGVLQPYGRRQRVTGFPVEPGEHQVLVRTDRCEGEPRTVTLSPAETRFVLLMADIEDGYRCRILLRGG